MAVRGFYPAPNPRVISTTTEKPFEFYLDLVDDYYLFEVFALYLATTSFAWVVHYSRGHDNYLPNKQILIFDSTGDLITCLSKCPKFKTVSKVSFEELVSILPQSSWYCHPTYPVTLSQVQT